MTNITIGIVDDHKLFRQGMAGLLNDQEGLEVTLEASNGLELLDKLSVIRKKRPKVALPKILLMDVQMPEMDGIECTKYVSAKYPEVKVIALTMHDNDQMIYHLIENGAAGFLPKNADAEVVVDAIFSVNERGYYINERISAIMLKGVSRRKIVPAYTSPLSEREIEVLRLICGEHTIKEIAEILNLSHRTIESHKVKLIEKVGAKNTVGLVLYAMNHNLLGARI
ncbi:MAG: two component transcriptional regulator, LuxR family [Bacteroidetes bacterium]|jgi:DNA-binding NarL/FixJ family response regulator|nr:two component transcriptional regulator, LuxR family [Bacteroidota bacterium]